MIYKVSPGSVGLSKLAKIYMKSSELYSWVIAISRRVSRGYLALFLLMSGVILSFPLVSVEAASFDGTYNYAYNLNGPNGWETHRVDSGFIVSGGRISSNPSAFSGTVDSSGNVHFTGPSPYGSPSATFTGVIKSDGTGEGDHRDSQGLVGRWSVAARAS